MCNLTGIAFGEATLTPDLVAGRTVLEVGALDVNGSLRPHVESLGPARYVGVDIAPGPRVDEVVDASDLIDHFGTGSFDLVITTEMLEHIRDWRVVVHNLKGVLAPGGHLVVTTRSIGFPYHGFPHDFWRYEPTDMQAIFADLEIQSLERDWPLPGCSCWPASPSRSARRRPTSGCSRSSPVAASQRSPRPICCSSAWPDRPHPRDAPASFGRGVHSAGRRRPSVGGSSRPSGSASRRRPDPRSSTPSGEATGTRRGVDPARPLGRPMAAADCRRADARLRNRNGGGTFTRSRSPVHPASPQS